MAYCTEVKVNDRIYIGDVIVEVKNGADGRGNNLSLAIVAPKNMEIWKEGEAPRHPRSESRSYNSG